MARTVTVSAFMNIAIALYERIRGMFKVANDRLSYSNGYVPTSWLCRKDTDINVLITLC